ncbi:MAG: aspartate/glutamate racemase family protein [Trueperaceae bacterium]
MPRILVLNPNGNPAVTDGVDSALDDLRRAMGATIDVAGLTGTPFGIESQRDVDAVAGPVARYVADHEDAYDAFVIACFSDPGLHGAREATRKPVLGIASSGLSTALALGEAVGVISIGSGSLPRHQRLYRAMGVASRVRADLPIGASVADLADGSGERDGMQEAMAQVGRRLVTGHACDVLVLGCAGMARYRAPLEAALGVRVIDPTQAATGMAITAAAWGLGASRGTA